MAQIRTIDGERHNVKETIQDIDEIITSMECIETGIVKLNWLVILSGWESGEETETRKYEPVSFIRTNIMMYY